MEKTLCKIITEVFYIPKSAQKILFFLGVGKMKTEFSEMPIDELSHNDISPYVNMVVHDLENP